MNLEAPPIIPLRVRHGPRRFPTLALSSLGIGVIIAILFLFNPSENAFYPRCALYATTGLLCPGCGGLRAMHQLSHGHFLMALRCNPILVLSLPLLLFFGFRLALREIQGLPWRPISLPTPWLKLLLGLLVVFSVLRNLRFPPFIYLGPP